MSKTIFDQALEMLKKNKEVELYKFIFAMSGKLDFYTDKVYTAGDGDKITRRVVLASIFGVKYRLSKIKFVGTALIKWKSCLVEESLNYGNEPTHTLYYGDISGYSFSITEAMKEITNNKSYLYFLGKDGSLYAFANEEENKDAVELLLSKGLINRVEDYFTEELK